MNKTHLLLCLCLGIYFGGYAQTTANNLLIGGNINWTTFKEDGAYYQPYRTTQHDRFMFTGNFGTFIQDALAVGLVYRQEFDTSTREDHTQTPVIATMSKIHSITLGPFIRKYFALGDRFSFYTQATLGYSLNYLNSKQDNVEFSSSKYKNLVANVQPGLVFFASNKIGIELTVPGLEYTLIKGKNGSTVQGLSAQFNLPALNMGLSFYLNR